MQTQAADRWQPPADWRRVRTIDAHTGGEPFRVVVAGGPQVPGDTILARRRWAMQHADDLRRLLMLEPRGHADMYGCLLTEPVSAGADFGVLFLHNAGCSTMCGHGIVAVVTVVLETGMLPGADGPRSVTIDAPAGRIEAVAELHRGRVHAVSFRNVPSFALALDLPLTVPGHGELRCDLAFGGAFYAVLDAAMVGLSCAPEHTGALIAAGRAIQRAVQQQHAIAHPSEPELGFLYGVIFTGPALQPGHHSRNVCVFADGEVDRSPTGTGVSARAAIERARGRLALGAPLVIESIVGSTFTVRALQDTACGPHAAIVPEVTGSAVITGRHEFLLAPDDPFPRGFLLR